MSTTKDSTTKTSFKTNIINDSDAILAEWFSLIPRDDESRREVAADIGAAMSFCVACQMKQHCGMCVCCP